jgi:hypothetical protein
MRTARTVGALALLLVVGPVFAAPAKKSAAAPKNTVAYYSTIDKQLTPVKLTDDESAKLDALKKDYEQKFKDAYAKTEVLTPDQKKAGDDARSAAKADGKKGKELTQAVADAEKLTDEQKAKRKDANKDLAALRKEFRGKVLDLLTDDQKKQLADAKPAKSSKPKKSAKADSAAPAPTTSN